MKREFRNFYFLILLSTGITVMMEPKPSQVHQPDDAKSFSYSVSACLAEKTHGTLECMNRGALSTLQAWNEDDEIDMGNIRLERVEGQSRDLLDLDYDPKDFTNVVKAASRLLERRSFKWDLSNLYPGLQMRVGPNLNGNGLLEFVVDERAASINNRQSGTGRLLVRQLLLPFLLGFKFNLASLIPLLFGILLFVTKKALLLSKVALILIGIMGWHSTLNNSFGQYSGFGGHVQYPQNYYGDHQFVSQYQFRRQNRLHQSSIPPYNQHVIRELVSVYERENEDAPDSRKKNFVWTKDE